MLRKELVDPILSIDPTEPTLSKDAVEPILKADKVDKTDPNDKKLAAAKNDPMHNRL